MSRDMDALVAGFGDGAGARLARQHGVERIELRYEEARVHALRAANGTMDADEHVARRGIGVRAIVRGAVGFAARAFDGADAEALVSDAIAAACDEARGRAMSTAASPETEEEPARGRHEAPCAEDPWAVPEEAQRTMLVEATRRLQAHGAATARAAFFAAERLLGTSEGTYVAQRLTHASGVLAVAAEHDGIRETCTRSFVGAGGYELVRALGAPDTTVQLADEAHALVRAAPCPNETTTLIIGPRAMARVLHDTFGHALEGDRLLEPGGVLDAAALGRRRIGSTAVDIAADARIPGALGTFGWDDEGVPARRTPLVQRGLLVGALSTRRVAAALGLGRSAGCARAATFSDLPRVRATNLVLEADPTGPSLEELIADTAQGVLLDSAELAWEIRDGRRTRMLRRPRFDARTLWSRCEVVGRDAEAHGLVACEREGQRLAVGLRGSAARFRAVALGASP